MDVILKDMKKMVADVPLLRSDNRELRADNSDNKALIAKQTNTTVDETEPTQP